MLPGNWPAALRAEASASMPAHVVERMHGPIVRARDDDAVAGDLAEHVLTRPRDFLGSAGTYSHRAKQRVELAARGTLRQCRTERVGFGLPQASPRVALRRLRRGPSSMGESVRCHDTTLAMSRPPEAPTSSPALLSRAWPMGFDRDWCQPGDWRGRVRAAVTLRRQRRRLESMAGRGRGPGIDAHRAVLRRGEHRFGRHRRSLLVHASPPRLAGSPRSRSGGRARGSPVPRVGAAVINGPATAVAFDDSACCLACRARPSSRR